jgi:hypothetical protein
MKRIKAMNGYTIYQSVSKRDENKYGVYIDCYAIWKTSDVREFGLDYLGCMDSNIDSLELAEELTAYFKEVEG